MLEFGLAVCLLLQTPQSQNLASIEEPDFLRVVVHGKKNLVSRLIQRGFDATSHPAIGRNYTAAQVILDERDVPLLRRVAGPIIVMERSRPFREIAEARRRAAGVDLPPDARYHTPTEIAAELLKMEKAYPKIALRVDLNARYSVGLTHGNRRIYALKISDNPSKSEDEPAMLLATNHHSRELNTIVLALYSAERLLGLYATDAKIKKLVDENEIWVVPTLNPDGLAYVWSNNHLWRKNRRDNGSNRYGVDLNRNYPYFWSRCGSSTNPGSDTYHGPSAGSEPETRVMIALGTAEVFERMLDMHSYSRDVRFGYNALTGPRLPSSLKAYWDKIQAEVANAMRYKTNSSCCCGGNQHWHLAENGTLSYLAEMDTAFQPAWSQTQIEIQRAWAGVRFMFERAVPLRGHVVSLAGNKPLGGEIEVVGQPLRDGQKRRSSPRHGRYAMWLPTGTYSLLFKAPGHVSRTVKVSLVDGKTLDMDVQLVPSLRPAVLSSRGTPKLGTTMSLDVSSPDDANGGYFVGAAFGSTPGIDIGPRNVPLNADALLANGYKMTGVFVNALGTLSATGKATMDFVIPNILVFAGLKIHFCGITIDSSWPSSVKGISNSVVVTLQR
jgi:hypothetical protein